MKINNNLINTFKNKNRPPFFDIWIGWWVGSIISVICNFINVITFCFWRPYWDMRWLLKYQKKQTIFMVNKMVELSIIHQKNKEESIVKLEEQALADLDAGKIANDEVDRNLFS